MKILFTRSHTPGSALIRLATWSLWSHVGVLIGDRVLDSTWRRGVALREVDEFVGNASALRAITIDTMHPLRVVNALRSQLGKPYDVAALMGLPLRRDWQKPDAWFCSELVAWAFQVSGQPLFREDHLYRITPQHLWMLPEVAHGHD